MTARSGAEAGSPLVCFDPKSGHLEEVGYWPITSPLHSNYGVLGEERTLTSLRLATG
jgi:hypothetical protein